jgi:monoamine oxidase
LVQRLFRDSRQAVSHKITATEHLERRVEAATDRREFLRSVGRTAVAAASLGSLAMPAFAASTGPSKSIAIVGAGLAGLTCAWRLRQAGLRSTIYEAAPRLGGRCFTRRGYFAEGQVIERGGELIDTGHTAVRDLATELGLTLDDVLMAVPTGTEPFYHFEGRTHSYAEVLAEFQTAFDAIEADVNAAGYPTTFDSYTHRGRVLDQLSVAD